MTVAEGMQPGPREAGLAAPARGGGLSLRTFDALRYREFRLLFGANTLQFGSMQMQLLVRGVLVFQLTASFEKLGLVSLAHAIPGLLFTLFGGIIADRAPKRAVVGIAQTINMLNAWTLGILAFTGAITFPHLLISAALHGSVNAVLMPTKQALVPDVVPRDRLMNAIALLTSGQNLMQLVGPVLGGLLIHYIGPAAGFGVMGAMYAIALTFTSRLPAGPMYASEDAPRPAKQRIRPSDLADGVRYVLTDRTIRTIIVVNFLIIIVAMPYTMMLPGFVSEVLHGGELVLSALMAMTGTGAVAGSLMIASLPARRRGSLLIVTGAILGASLLAFAVSTNVMVTLVIMLVVGFGQAMRMSLGQVLVQHYSPDEYRGRVMSVWMIQYSIMSLGTYGLGVLSEWFGPQWAIGTMAGALIVLMALVWITIPRMRRLE